MTLNEWYNFLKLYGLQGTGLMFVLFVLWQIGRTDWFANKFKNFIGSVFNTGKTKTNGLTISNVENHNMFNYIDFWIYSRVPTLKFTTEYRTIVFRKYLTIFLIKYRDNVKQYVVPEIMKKWTKMNYGKVF